MTGDRPARRRDGDDQRPSRTGLPRWLVPAIAAAVAAIVVLAILVSRGGGPSDAGSCLPDLLEHVPADADQVSGTDLVQARAAGYDGSASLDGLGEVIDETGVLPDPLNRQFRFPQLSSVEALTSRTGVVLDDLDCALTIGEGRAVMAGEFSVERVRGSELGTDGILAASTERLALATGGGDPGELLEPLGDESLQEVEPVARALDVLREEGAYSFVIEVGGDDDEAGAGGIGVGHEDGERTMIVAYAFADDDEAADNVGNVVERVNDAARGTASISNDDLEVAGSVVRGTIPTRVALSLERLMLTGPGLIF